MHGDGDRTRALAEERDVLRIATKSSNVVAHPLQSHHLVKETGITGHIGRAKVQKAETGHAILHRHHDHVLLRDQGFVIVHVKGGRAGIEAT